jgi:hypothetical protein
MLKRTNSVVLGYSALAAAAAVLLTACSGGGAPIDSSVTSGRISGELTVVGPIKKNVDLSIGVVPADRDDCLQSQVVGRFASDIQAAIDGRQLSFDFDGLPLGAFNVLVFSQNEDGSHRTIYYRSPKLKLTTATPQLSGFSEDVSLTGPPPWGSISGLLLLNGANDTLQDLSLTVYSENKGVFGYTFSVWDAGFGALFFTVGGLSTGDYRLGISEPVSHQLLGYAQQTVSLTASRPDTAGVVLYGDFFNMPPDGEGHFISGKAIFTSELPAGRHLAVLALDEANPQLTLSPTYHIRPEQLDDQLEADYFLGWLHEGDYRLAIYALDFVGGEHKLISELDKPILIDSDHPLDTGIIIRGDVSLIP